MIKQRITIYNTIILVRSVIKFLDRNKSKNFIARRAKIIVYRYFIKRLCTGLNLMAISKS